MRNELIKIVSFLHCAIKKANYVVLTSLHHVQLGIGDHSASVVDGHTSVLCIVLVVHVRYVQVINPNSLATIICTRLKRRENFN